MTNEPSRASPPSETGTQPLRAEPANVALALYADAMAGGHGPDCVCELCWAERTVKPAPLDDRIPLTRAEFLAAIDRAFNAGVDAERA